MNSQDPKKPINFMIDTNKEAKLDFLVMGSGNNDSNLLLKQLQGDNTYILTINNSQ